MNRSDARDLDIHALRDQPEYGTFIPLYDSGEIDRFLSSGLTAKPLRLPDPLSHVRSKGLPNLHPCVEVGPS